MLASSIRATAFAWGLAACSVVNAGAWTGGIGVVGDSYSDEYQFYAPDRARARNWVEFLADKRGFDFGDFSTAGRGEPRNEGFAYNWARSGATSSDLVDTGQVAGVAEQVTRGEVGLVVIFIGGNDFIGAVNAADPIAALRITAPRVIANLRRATETILDARADVKVVVVTVPDLGDLPEIRQAIRDGRLSDSLVRSASHEVGQLNMAIRGMALELPRVAVADFDLQSRIAKALAGNVVPVGGRKLLRDSSGDDPNNFFLADGRHAGSVGQGLLARLIVDTINARFQATIPRIDESEILRFADSVGIDRDVVRAEAAAATSPNR